MSYQILVGAEIGDQQGYQAYRENMLVLLREMGGDFAYDFHAEATPMSQNGQHFNRMFVISFPDEAVKNNFFAHPKYKEIKQRYFVDSVKDIQTLGCW